MKFMIVNNSTEASMSLAKKMAEQAKPSAIIPLSEDELRRIAIINDRIKLPKDIAEYLVETHRCVMEDQCGAVLCDELLAYIAQTYPELVEEYPCVFEDMN